MLALRYERSQTCRDYLSQIVVGIHDNGMQ
jgi:hypothetical protein